jgi:hypothetical protein
MITLLCFFLTLFASLFKSKSRLEAENAALRLSLVIVFGQSSKAVGIFGQRKILGSHYSAHHCQVFVRNGGNITLECGKVLNLLGIWRGASFA